MANLRTPTNSAIHRTTPIRNGDVPTWVASSDAVALSTGTAATTTLSMGYIFHAATTLLKLELLAARLSWAAGAGAGTGILAKLARIPNVMTGGTVNTIQPLDSRDTYDVPTVDPVAGCEARFGATGGAGARVILATHRIHHASAGSLDLAELVRHMSGRMPVINAGVAEGLEVLIVTTGTGPATAADLSLSFEFTARPAA
jgi:hypothetical protein